MAGRGRDKFAKVKGILKIMSFFYSLFPLKIRKKLFEHYRGTKGLKGIAIRYALLKTIAKKCGENVSIQPDCYIFYPENLEIGDNVSIHPMCYFFAQGGISIGNDVSIAHGVTIMTTNHQFDRTDIPIKDQPLAFGEVIIHDDVWIGAKATILYGRTIGKGSIIGAASVVTKDIKENTINVGVPAKAVKER